MGRSSGDYKQAINTNFMMRKLVFFSVLIIGMSACGKAKSGDAIAQEVCDCYSKANELTATNPDRAAAQNDCLTKQREAWDKVKSDVDNSKEFNDRLAICAKEQIKNSVGQ
jgi:hypothetical protein